MRRLEHRMKLVQDLTLATKTDLSDRTSIHWDKIENVEGKVAANVNKIRCLHGYMKDLTARVTDLTARVSAIEETEIPETTAHIELLEHKIEKEALNTKTMAEEIGVTTRGIITRLEEIDMWDIQDQIPKTIGIIQMLEEKIEIRMNVENERLSKKIEDLEAQITIMKEAVRVPE